MALYIGANDMSATVTSGVGSDSITVFNNNIQKAYTGIFVTGSTPNSLNTNLNISKNIIGADETKSSNYVSAFGINISGALKGVISSNEVYNIKTSSSVTPLGISVQASCDSLLIEKNVLHGLHYTGTSGYGAVGILLNGGSNAV